MAAVDLAAVAADSVEERGTVSGPAIADSVAADSAEAAADSVALAGPVLVVAGAELAGRRQM